MEKKNIINQKIKYGLQFYEDKKYENAKKIYEEIIASDPSIAMAHYMLGSSYVRLKNYEKAITHYKETIKINPNFIDAYNNLAITYWSNKDIKNSISYFEETIRLSPSNFKALNNLGLVLVQSGKINEAKNCFEKAIKLNPALPELYNNLANVEKKLGNYKTVKENFQKAIELNPSYNDAYYNFGKFLFETGKYNESKFYFEKTIEQNSSHFNAYYNLGVVNAMSDNYHKASDLFKKSLEIKPTFIEAQQNLANAHIKLLSSPKKIINESLKTLKLLNEQHEFNVKIDTHKKNTINKFRLKHDVKQAEMISSNNYKLNGLDKFLRIGNEVLNKNTSNEQILLSNNEINSFLDYYKTTFIYESQKLPKYFINPDKNWKNIEDEYIGSSKRIIYIDDFLSTECLFELRKFCLLSKIWLIDYKNKYLGAFNDRGFVSNIHLKIGNELKEKMPKIFSKHLLTRFWGFKYDTKLGKGINIHADAAIENLNFWITPNEFHKNKEGGGLKIYDIPAPDDWHFNDYNNNPEKIYQFLNLNKPNLIKVPYKFNRAVLFNSAYFHETDEIDFEDKYEGQRINITYLFGERKIKIQ